MLKAAVDEDREATFGESEIRPPWQINLPSPSPQSGFSEERGDDGLCGLVAVAANQPHDSRAFHAVNGVDHPRSATLRTRLLATLLNGRRGVDLREALSG